MAFGFIDRKSLLVRCSPNTNSGIHSSTDLRCHRYRFVCDKVKAILEQTKETTVEMGGYVHPPFEIPQSLLDDLTRLGPLLDVGKAAQELGQRIFTQHLPGSAIDTNLKMVAYVIFGKAFKSFQAIHNLCLSGCGSDAMALCGTLFENHVDLRYLQQAPIHRPKRYIQFEQVEKYYSAQKILRRKRLPKGLRKTYRGYEKDLKPQVAGILKYFAKPSFGWSQRSLYDRARAVGADFNTKHCTGSSVGTNTHFRWLHLDLFSSMTQV